VLKELANMLVKTDTVEFVGGTATTPLGIAANGAKASGYVAGAAYTKPIEIPVFRILRRTEDFASVCAPFFCHSVKAARTLGSSERA
jgi:hypothetical protein